ncbi:MAG: LysR substrate-binding domain-containing protein [Paracoccaceae bacterium]
MDLNRRYLPPLPGLRALEALDRLGSASAVAEELALTQSAVSRQIQSLEAQLGTELVLRDRRRLTLTQSAQEYVAQVRPALEQIVQASMRLQVAPAGGTINLAILPTFGMRWLVPRLPEFTRAHPDLTLNMSTRFQPFPFGAEPFDAALHYGTGDWSGTEKMLLRYEQVVPVCAPALVQTRPACASDLLTLPLLHIQTRPTAWADWFTAQGETPPVPVPGTMYDQFATIMQAALHGLGVALVPDYLAEPDLAAGRLVVTYGRPVEANGAYYLVWPTSKAQDPALQKFRDWLATQAEPEDLLPR